MDQTATITISRRIIYFPLLLITGLLLACFALLDIYFSSNLEKKYEKHLLQLARSGAQMIKYEQDLGQIQDYDRLADFFVMNSRLRVSILDGNGEIIGDSNLSREEILSMGNQADRPEIKNSSNSGIGISKRFSPTTNTNLMFVAVKYGAAIQKFYFRISLPLDDLERERLHQRILLGGCCLVTLIIAIIFSLIASRHLLSLVEMNKIFLKEKVDERTQQIGRMQNIITQLTVCHSIEEILEVIPLGAAKLLPDHSGAISLFHSSRDKLEVAATWKGEWVEERSYNPEQCWAIRTGQPYESAPADGNIACEHSSFAQERMLCIPIAAQGEIYGVFHFSCDQNRPWFPEERQLISSIAEHVSLTIANLQLRDNLKQQAIRDPLTGLYNRRYLLEILDSEISRASRKNTKIGLLMIDIDHFKKFNDDHGHDVGDFILGEFGTLLKKNVRKEDTPCRYGGEEFTVLLPDVGIEGMLNVAEKLRTTVRKHDFQFNNKFYGPITISIGCAIYPEQAKSMGRLLKKADTALYEAKQTGRDKIILCS